MPCRHTTSSSPNVCMVIVCVHICLCRFICCHGVQISLQWVFVVYVCASVQACMCMCVCGASCCAGNDKGGSRGLELIKCNDAMWGDLAVFVLIKKPPHHQQEKKKEAERQNMTERWKQQWGDWIKKSLRKYCKRAVQKKSRTMQ